MAGAVASFNYNTWIQRYPEFMGVVTEILATSFFNEATLYHANDGSGPVTDAGQQLILLNMLTAHIAKLNVGTSGDPPSDLVGRISGATEGSVSVSTDLALPGTAQWYAQTQYGFSYWQAILPYRSMVYKPGPRRYFGPIYPGYGVYVRR